jgi:hypothetical protein
LPDSYAAWVPLVGKMYFCACVGLIMAGCVSVSPYDTAPDQSAHLVGRRAILNHLGKEFVYFAQLDKLDLRDKWSDYPHDIYVPPGYHTLVVTCEWYSTLSNGPPITVAHRIRQRFIIGHEYDFSSRLVGQGLCETSMVDLTLEQRNASVTEAQPVAPVKVEKKAAKKR